MREIQTAFQRERERGRVLSIRVGNKNKQKAKIPPEHSLPTMVIKPGKAEAGGRGSRERGGGRKKGKGTLGGGGARGVGGSIQTLGRVTSIVCRKIQVALQILPDPSTSGRT